MLPVNPEDLLPFTEHQNLLTAFRKKARNDVIQIYKKYKSLNDFPFKWGDEIEYSIVKFDHENKKVYLRNNLPAEIVEYMSKNENDHVLYQPEFLGHMLETVPKKPYDDSVKAFKTMESNLKIRRDLVKSYLSQNGHESEVIMGISCFPLLGSPNFFWPNTEIKPEKSEFESLFLPEDFIYLEGNRKKHESRHLLKGEKMSAYIPLFMDKKTPNPFIEDLTVHSNLYAKKMAYQSLSRPNEIYLDSDAFGLGCSCLQVTFQLKDINEAMFIYDQLSALAPIFLAMSGNSPIYRGFLSNVDTRYE